MADYLDAPVRGYSESVNADASSTVVSPLVTPIPSLKPSPLIGTKVQTNIILKSHGRPPWYFPGLLLKSRRSKMSPRRYGEDGQSISPAFVIGIAGVQADFTPKSQSVGSHKISYRWFFQWKGR
jgi:hypothetical protein